MAREIVICVEDNENAARRRLQLAGSQFDDPLEFTHSYDLVPLHADRRGYDAVVDAIGGRDPPHDQGDADHVSLPLHDAHQHALHQSIPLENRESWWADAALVSSSDSNWPRDSSSPGL